MEGIPAFTLTSVRRLAFGWGGISKLPDEAASLGRRVLLVTGGQSLARSGKLAVIVDALRDRGLSVEVFQGVEPEPSTETVEAARSAARQAAAEVVVGIGGGSVLDVARATAGLLDDPLPVAERLARAEEPERRVGLILCPTTSGTGSEVTMTTVLIDRERGIKSSLRHPTWLADLALVDPELTVTTLPHVTASTGFDALVQAVESFISRGANPATDALAEQGARLLLDSLETAYAERACRWAREQASLGSVLAGMALTNARLGLVHGLAHPVGVRTGAAHGQVCAVLLDAVLVFNRPVAEAKMALLSRRLGLATEETPAALATDVLLARLRSLRRQLGLGMGLRDLGLEQEEFLAVAQESLTSGSTKANPREVTARDAVGVLQAAY